MLKMSDRIGSLTPGKQADIAVMSLGPLAMWPVHDAVAISACGSRALQYVTRFSHHGHSG